MLIVVVCVPANMTHQWAYYYGPRHTYIHHPAALGAEDGLMAGPSPTLPYYLLFHRGWEGSRTAERVRLAMMDLPSGFKKSSLLFSSLHAGPHGMAERKGKVWTSCFLTREHNSTRYRFDHVWKPVLFQDFLKSLTRTVHPLQLSMHRDRDGRTCRGLVCYGMCGQKWPLSSLLQISDVGISICSIISSILS